MQETSYFRRALLLPIVLPVSAFAVVVMDGNAYRTMLPLLAVGAFSIPPYILVVLPIEIWLSWRPRNVSSVLALLWFTPPVVALAFWVEWAIWTRSTENATAALLIASFFIAFVGYSYVAAIHLVFHVLKRLGRFEGRTSAISRNA